MKILWQSVGPWVNTGYGQQTAMFTPRIRGLGHEVAISACFGWQGSVGTWNGMTVYPADATGFNKLSLRKYVDREGGADQVQVIALQDIFTWVDPKFGGCRADFKGLKLAAWVPIDCDPVSPLTQWAITDYNVTPIAMSRFGERTLAENGFEPLYVPHGIDTNVFKPGGEQERTAARKLMRIPEDRFVIGMVANNQGLTPPRKAFPQVLEAFSIFQRDHPDAFLYLHTEALGTIDGLNLVALADVFGIPKDAIGFVNQDAYLMGEISQRHLAAIYNAMDVLANPSYGEGFGIPIVEAQACGIPVIVTDWTAMTELCGAGWLVDGEPWYNPGLGSRWKCPSVLSLLEAMDAARDSRGDQQLRDKAREFALEYDADLVTERYWVPVLERLGARRWVPPLPNRQMRRQAEKAAA